MKKAASMCVLILLVLGCPLVAQAQEESVPKIQMAILLDTSGSMTGLIEQAKAQLWTIVNEFAITKKDGKVPDFEVALYQYGTPSLGKKSGYVRMILPLTTDLDKVSEKLFALTTSGGDEYCGTVIKAATEGLKWSESNEDLKVIFIAGNEPFTQGKVDFHKACPAAIAKGIVVNTIFCGPYDKGVSTNWKDGAVLADGNYINIDQNAKVVHIAAPQDAEIARLGVDLNATYIGYGAQREARAILQAQQDTNAVKMGRGSSVQRAVSKSNAFYRNAKWDLVDAVRENKLELDKLDEKDLPEEMKKMSVEEREAYVKAQAEARARIQEQIKKRNAVRNAFVAEERKKLAASGENTLDVAIIKSVRQQAAEKHFDIK